MADEERQHAERLLHTYRQRLRYREHQKARLGDTADPSVDADITELKQNIAMLEPVVEPAPAEEVLQVVKRHIADDYLFIYRQVVKFGERLTSVERGLDETRHDDAVWRAIHKTAHVADEHDRIAGQRRNLRLLIGVLVAVAVLAALVLLR